MCFVVAFPFNLYVFLLQIQNNSFVSVVHSSCALFLCAELFSSFITAVVLFSYQLSISLGQWCCIVAFIHYELLLCKILSSVAWKVPYIFASHWSGWKTKCKWWTKVVSFSFWACILLYTIGDKKITGIYHMCC